ncbi:FG-GAP repeat domain-containing protein [Streptomyces sp. 184]|uniref:FG-GAP repeat domain-containing protein n=1 Tax=Streptomyces sp. 184 TaxID=1827526 RepID=UPI003891AAF6
MCAHPSGVLAASRRLLAAVLLPTALLAAGCGSGGGGEDGDGERGREDRSSAACTLPSERGGGSGKTPGRAADGPAGRADVDGDGHADAVVNGWYGGPESPGGRWRNNRFVLRAADGGPDPSAAFPLSGCLPPHGPLSSLPEPVADDHSVQLTGDLDDDGYADVLAHGFTTPDMTFDERQRILWGGPDGPGAATDLPRGADPAAAVGDFDGNGALDLLTLAPAGGEDERGAQLATVLRGPLARTGGKPRGETETDVGFDGWASVTDVLVGDFDGDGRDDLVTRATYDEEDLRFEMDMPDAVHDAAFYRGTPAGLRLAGPVPGVTAEAPARNGGATPLAAGDFDGDGTDDIVARQEEGDGALVVYGGPSGPGTGRAGAELGWQIGLRSAAGDVNGDGTDDVVTSHAASGGEGEVTVAPGGPDGVDADSARVFVPQDVGAKRGGRRNADHLFGWQLHLADLDTDGDDDLLVGTYRAGEPPDEPGYWILPGTPEGTSAAGRSFLATRDAGRAG